MTTRRLAWKQQSFEEIVIDHWSTANLRRRCIGSKVIHRNDERIKFLVAERSVNWRRFLEREVGDIGSENADMSNVISCENHDRRKSKGFSAP